MLARDRLLFATGDPATSWEARASEVANVKRPWYGIGTYVRFTVNGKGYGIAFRDAADIAPQLTGSYLAESFEGVAGAAWAGHALRTATVVQARQLAADVLGMPEAAAKAEAEWQAQQTRAPVDD